MDTTILKLIRSGALFVCNHSGGKDSQAMLLRLARIIPHGQLVIVHAHLPGVEWENSVDHIRETSLGIDVHVCQAVKTFFEMVDHRGKFPDAQRRQCTSDLKRGPIEKLIRHLVATRKNKTVVNCMGMRAQESPGRAKKEVFKLDTKNSVAGRTWFNWLPIHSLTTKEVFSTIHTAGQRAFWIYYEGMTRKSCCFCIMASQHDLRTAARLRPELAQQYIDTEKRLGHTLQMSGKPLTELLTPQ
jgi:DNA sulfur modification protein DndC